MNNSAIRPHKYDDTTTTTTMTTDHHHSHTTTFSFSLTSLFLYLLHVLPSPQKQRFVISRLGLYRPDALPHAHLTASEQSERNCHWKQHRTQHAAAAAASTHRADAFVGCVCCMGVFSEVTSRSWTESPAPCDLESETELPSVETSCTHIRYYTYTSTMHLCCTECTTWLPLLL